MMKNGFTCGILCIWGLYGIAKQFLNLNASKEKKKLRYLSDKEQSMIKLFLDVYRNRSQQVGF